MKRTNVFISYCHRDRRWLERLKVHLIPLADDFDTDIWEDTQIKAGLKWREEIERAIDRANVAVLIISADFLASRFIRDNELPPLLKAADEDGALILPIIAGPSLFTKNSNLSLFQAINSPDDALLSMSEGKQEEAFLRLAERILERCQRPPLRRDEQQKPTGVVMAASSEDFFVSEVWTKLIKVGDWVFDDKTRRFFGTGTHTYLLSRHEYGSKPFEVTATVEFSQFVANSAPIANMMNAGIILGWNQDKENPRYYNILLSGQEILIERVGFNGGPEGRDYEHVTEPTPLKIVGAHPYNFTIKGSDKQIEVLLDDQRLLKLENPRGVIGRVGLRPWRSQLACSSFVVRTDARAAP